MMLKRRFGFYLLVFWFLIFSLILGYFINVLVENIDRYGFLKWRDVLLVAFGFFALWFAILLILQIPSLTVVKGKVYVIFAMLFIPVPFFASFFYYERSFSGGRLANFIFLFTSLAMIYSNLLTIDDDYKGAFSFLKCFKPYRLENESEKSASAVEPHLIISDKMYPAEAYQHKQHVILSSQPPAYYSKPPAYYSITPQTPVQPSNPFIIH